MKSVGEQAGETATAQDPTAAFFPSAAMGEKLHALAKFEVLHSHRVPTMNIHVNASEHLNGLLEKHEDVPFVAAYFRRDDGRWQFSLRSRPGFDVAAIAKHYGGGGHAQAAGFTVTRLPW